MLEISLKTVDELQYATMRLEAITYLQRLLIEDTDGWISAEDPERVVKDNAAALLFSLQSDALKELQDIVFGEAFT